MHKLKLILLAAAAAVLAACSGGSDDTLTNPGTGPGGQPAAQVATLTLLTSSPQIPSDGATPATISALVRDNNNNVMRNVSVLFTANSGSLVVTQPATTDDNGVLTAVLSTAGDPTNRTITVSGQAGTASSQVSVNVIGTTLTLTGPASLPTGSTGPYAVTLKNAANAPVGGRAVTVTSARANGISQTPITTNGAGEASFTLAANNAGADTLSVSALGIQTNLAVAVSSDQFAFTAPAAGTEVALATPATITVRWTQGGAAVANQTINFASTRGTLSGATAITNASGDASVTISATNAGGALLTATNSAGTSIQRAIEFVATTPSTLELQADPFTVATSSQSSLTAIVRDAAGNLVKNQVITFTLDDITGGFLSVAQATTDSQGRASTTYNASTTTSAVNGVHVRATVQGVPTATDVVDLTVARREVFISIGTGNEIDEPNTAQYRKEWVIQLTDAQGNGVSNVNVNVSILSERYWDGVRVWGGAFWVTRPGTEALPVAGCDDEDDDRNGQLGPTEDNNTNGRIEAGNILSVAPHGGTGNTVKTDVNGFALIDVYYPQEYAYWLEVTLQASASVQGTEFSERSTFVPPGSADDFGDEAVAPPGVSSPFGTDGVCLTPPPPDGP